MVKDKKVKSTKFKKISMVIFFLLLIVAIAFGVKSFFPCSKMKKETYKITSFDGRVKKAKFDLEVADNNEARLKGLMYRKSLPENTGMLFDFEKLRILNIFANTESINKYYKQHKRLNQRK